MQLGIVQAVGFQDVQGHNSSLQPVSGNVSVTQSTAFLAVAEQNE